MSCNCCCHRHYYCGQTSCDCCHTHKYKGKTSYGPNCGPHVHYIECYTTKEDGHRHYYCIKTSVSCPAPDGGHIHYISGPTECEDCHVHYIYDVTSSC